jgi:hypothetical protein
MGDASILKSSIRATYSSTHEPNPYHVGVRLDDETILFQKPIADPFVRQEVIISPRRLLRSLLRWKPLTVTVLVGGDKERIDDVLELDDQWLVPGRTRRAAFHQHINERLREL